MRVVLQNERCTLYRGDCAELESVVARGSVDAIITDPPAGISFMGKKWDHDKGGRDQWIAALAALFKPAFASLKPGAHAFVWAIPRTSHWMAMALELAGFQIRDVHHHIFGTGFPKSLNISKAIDEHLGTASARVKVSEGRGRTGAAVRSHSDVHGDDAYEWPGTFDITGPASPEAARWEGYGTALKPAVEHWILARKPLDGTYAENVLTHGTGALNINACRIGPTNPAKASRWPAHLSFEHCTACLADACVIGCPVRDLQMQNGGARQFFYLAKPPRKEKDAGLAHLQARSGGEATGRIDGSAGVGNPRAGAGRTGGARNFHPTVKSVELMRWLVRLITPPNGVVLDIFAGSGTTGIAALIEGCRFVGVELGGDDGEYIPILTGRIEYALTLPYYRIRR